MYIKNEKNIQGKCSVCSHPVMVDEIGNGDVCSNCGWEQDSAKETYVRFNLIGNGGQTGSDMFNLFK